MAKDKCLYMTRSTKTWRLSKLANNLCASVRPIVLMVNTERLKEIMVVQRWQHFWARLRLYVWAANAFPRGQCAKLIWQQSLTCQKERVKSQARTYPRSLSNYQCVPCQQFVCLPLGWTRSGPRHPTRQEATEKVGLWLMASGEWSLGSVRRDWQIGPSRVVGHSWRPLVTVKGWSLVAGEHRSAGPCSRGTHPSFRLPMHVYSVHAAEGGNSEILQLRPISLPNTGLAWSGFTLPTHHLALVSWPTTPDQKGPLHGWSFFLLQLMTRHFLDL